MLRIVLAAVVAGLSVQAAALAEPISLNGSTTVMNTIVMPKKAEIEQLCVRAGEDALVDVGITDMDPELVNLLGRLRYRTSYGQNVLKHLIESAHIAGMMASELGLDPVLMKRGTLLHDIGKALTHEAQGSHAIVGAELARKYGESEAVAHCIEAHHDEVPPTPPAPEAMA